MEIEYIFRPKSQCVSIEKVFGSVIEEMQNMPDVTVFRSEAKKKGWWPFTMIYNIIRYSIKSHLYGRVFHITGDIQYVACLMNPRRTILTVHDLVPFHDQNVPKYAKFISYWFSYYFPLKHLNRVTCISEATKNDLLSFFPWAKDKVVVVNNPVSKLFTYSPREFNAYNPRILHIGTKKNKNLERVGEALKGVPCHLRIIGSVSERQSRILEECGIDYSYALGLTDEAIVQEYVNADIISFPSLFEGFGMPIIEGQAVGRLIVTSNIEPMLSISGRAAVLVDPSNVYSVKNGFTLATSGGIDIQQLIKEGQRNILKYQAKNICREYFNIYKNIKAKR